MDISIREAHKEDASFIAKAIIEAVGSEITLDFAGSTERIPLVYELFTQLAETEDSQYSYINCFVAETSNNDIAGVIIAYDGKDLKRLRKQFIRYANKILDYKIDEDKMADETSDDEIYIDTLCVFNQFRKQGVASNLINFVIERYAFAHKPLGLLVSKGNIDAKRLYDNLGFKKAGERIFAGEIMDHLQINNQSEGS